MITDPTSRSIMHQRPSGAEVAEFMCKFSGTPKRPPMATDAQPYIGAYAVTRVENNIAGLIICQQLSATEQGKPLNFLFGGLLDAAKNTAVERDLSEQFLLLVNELTRLVATQWVICLRGQDIDQLGYVSDEEAFWMRRGFSRLDIQYRYSRATQPVLDASFQQSFKISKYAGGDRKINEDVLALYRRTHRSLVASAGMTAAQLDWPLNSADVCNLICWDTDKLVGHALVLQMGDDLFVSNISISRRYWGTGASDQFSHAIVLEAAKRQCTTISAGVAGGNRPSRAMMERWSMRPVKGYVRLMME